MLLLRRPCESLIDHTIRAQALAPFTYDAVGWTARRAAPAGFAVNAWSAVIGRGRDDFERARRAMEAWRMLRLGWIERVGPPAPIRPGVLVGTLARQTPLWFLNVGRIVAVEDAPDVFAFSYGTLREYPIHGEERFSVELDAATGAVTFGIFSFSRPATLLTRVGRPMVGLLQRRFCREATAAMRLGTAGPDAAAGLDASADPDASAWPRGDRASRRVAV